MYFSISQRIIPDMGFLVQRCREVKSVAKKICVVVLQTKTNNINYERDYSIDVIHRIEQLAQEFDMIIVATFKKNGEQFNLSLASHRNVDYVYLCHNENISNDSLKKEFGAKEIYTF